MEGFDEEVRQMLIMMMAEVCREFEKLPIIKYTDILQEYSVFRSLVQIVRQYPAKGRKSRRKKMFDPYSVLGVSRDASDEEIKKSIPETEQEVSSGCQYQ